jgi:hypothetical protein
MKMYEELNSNQQVEDDSNQLGKTNRESLLSKFQIQSLEEVTERSEESDMTSHMSFNSIDVYSSSTDNNKSFDNSS